jgi:CDP-diglyceride synthetase
MLWKRVITAAVLLPLVLLALFKLPVQGITILIGAAVMTATWELGALIGFRQPWQRMLFIATILVAGIFGSIWLLRGGNVTPVLGVACVWWIYAIVHMVRDNSRHPCDGADLAGFLATVFG